MKEFEARLRTLDVPGEREAEERAWDVVRAAFVEREPGPRPSRRLRPALVLAAATAAFVAAAFTSPVRAVIDEVREAIGVEGARPALFSLPAPGRLLVDSDAGAWVVHADGSKRLLAGYREASWSPHGLFVVATRGNELVALEPDGDIRWTLARPGVRFPRWNGTETDTRIAYLSRRSLRVVAGDGTGDRALARRVRGVAPAWRPAARSRHVLAYVTTAERLVVLDADSGERLWRTPPIPGIAGADWSSDGRLVLVRARRSLTVYDASGRRRYELLGAPAASVRAAAFAPGREALAFVQWTRDGSDLWVVPRLAPDASGARKVFSGAGRFTGVEWSPNGRWLLVAWQDADQWVFIRSSRVRNIRAFSGISSQFESETFPALAGWCCR